MLAFIIAFIIIWVLLDVAKIFLAALVEAKTGKTTRKSKEKADPAKWVDEIEEIDAFMDDD